MFSKHETQPTSSHLHDSPFWLFWFFFSEQYKILNPTIFIFLNFSFLYLPLLVSAYSTIAFPLYTINIWIAEQSGLKQDQVVSLLQQSQELKTKVGYRGVSDEFQNTARQILNNYFPY